MKNLFIIFTASLFMQACNFQEEPEELGIFEQHRISSQIQTAESLRDYMDNKEYDEAIALFSSRQQAKIRKYKEEEELFELWCFAWTFDEGKLERYTHLIKENKAPFVFEQGEWKIDEQ